jgi:hypothetical protein
MTGMSSAAPGRPRLLRAPSAIRWIAADARDVTRIDTATGRAAVALTSVARGVASWQRRLERKRLLAVLRRAAIVALATASLLQIGALVSGRGGFGLWLAPALLVLAACLVLGLTRRTPAVTAARMLDRDLGLGAGVTTALELEAATGASGPRGLGALALADGRGALAASLVGARARLRPGRGELGSLITGVAVLALLLALPAAGGRGASAASAQRHTIALPAGGAGAQSAAAPVGATLKGFHQAPAEHTPSLAQVATGTARATGQASGHSPYGGGVSNNAPAGANAPASQTVGKAGSTTGTRATASSSSAAEGDASHEKATVGQQDGNTGTTGSASSQGTVQGISPNAGGQASAPKSPAAGGGKASTTGGSTRGGTGSSAPGTATGRIVKRGGTSGGATAGAARAVKNAANGVVPQLRTSNALPIQPGYESVPGSKGASGESASTSAGSAGGASHAGRATAGTAGGSAKGAAYVAPGAAGLAPLDRGLVEGYFGSSARIAASGW